MSIDEPALILPRDFQRRSLKFSLAEEQAAHLLSANLFRRDGVDEHPAMRKACLARARAKILIKQDALAGGEGSIAKEYAVFT